jgi:hypothetical protein
MKQLKDGTAKCLINRGKRKEEICHVSDKDIQESCSASHKAQKNNCQETSEDN